MTKKIIAAIIAAALALSLYGCSQPTEPQNPQEPQSEPQIEKQFTESDLAPAFEAYKLVLAETFGVETETTGYYRLYKASENEENKLLVNSENPDALIPEAELSDENGFQKGGDYDGYIIDPSYGVCYKVTNFANIEAIKESLREYMDDGVFTAAVENNFIEFDGAAYLLRGAKGYGAESADSLKITAQAEGTITAEAQSYLFEEADGKLILTFRTDGTKAILASATPEEVSESISADDMTALFESVLKYESGTAGASMKALAVGVDILNFGAATTMPNTDIAMAAENYKSALSLEDSDVFENNVDEIKAACDVLWTDEAASMLESAGITNAAESYDKDMAENIFAAIGRKG